MKIENWKLEIFRGWLVFCLLILTSYFLLLTLPVHAQGIVPCTGLDCKLEDIFELLVGIYNFLLGMAGMVALIFLVWGGIQMFIYHYSEHPQEVLSGAKLTVTRAIFGLIIIATAYLVVNTVLVLLGVQNPQNYFLGTFLTG